jgi:hypothetical protein
MESIETESRVVTVMAIRLVLGITILYIAHTATDLRQNKWVLIGSFIFVIYILDILDSVMVPGDKENRSMFYIIADKIVDIITLGYFVFAIIPLIDPSHYEIIKALWIFRVIGTLLLIYTRNEQILIIFGNYVEIGILLSVFQLWKYPLVVTLLFLSKIVQEIIKHYGNIHFLKFFNFEKIKDL